MTWQSVSFSYLGRKVGNAHIVLVYVHVGADLSDAILIDLHLDLGVAVEARTLREGVLLSILL